MKGKPPVKIPDIVIILIAIGITGLSIFAAYVKPKNTVRVLIRGPSEQWIFPLDADETVSVKGPLGKTVVRIRENEVWVESSPCDNQTCVATGHVRLLGRWAACLPNNVFFIIEGSDDPENAVDGTAW
jgi:hypothetical protein